MCDNRLQILTLVALLMLWLLKSSIQVFEKDIYTSLPFQLKVHLCVSYCDWTWWGPFSVATLNMMLANQNLSGFLADMGRLAGLIWSQVTVYFHLLLT